MIRIFLLGNFRVEVDEALIEETSWSRRKVKSLIKLLALQPSHRLHKEQAIELLWPDLDFSAASANLYRTIHLLRQILQRGAERDQNLVAFKEGTIRLNLSLQELWVDVDAFELALRQSRTESDPQIIARQLEEALKLYQGDLLLEDLYEEWTLNRREELKRSYQQALLQQATSYRQRQFYSPAINLLEKILASEPTNESAHRELIIVYTLAGQRSAALDQYQRCCQILADEQGLDPSPETLAVYQQVLMGEIRADKPSFEPITTPSTSDSTTNDQKPATGALLPPNLVNARRYFNNLPITFTSLVGREAEVTQAVNLLGQNTIRLLTLTGPAGVGKTRVALQVAARLREEGSFEHGVCFVSLASLNDPSLVPLAIAQATGIKEIGGQPILNVLKFSLKDYELLLVLDNFEQLLTAAPILAELLAACPILKLVVTSRALLHLYGEFEQVIQPLDLPTSRGWLPLEEIAGAPAVVLFMQRAKAADSRFKLTEKNAARVLEICRRLDGVPLAIELIAARIKLLSPETLLARLDKWLHLIVNSAHNLPNRQQTLQNTLDWSYNLLSEAEQQLFTRLAVFNRSCSLAAVTAVCFNGTNNTPPEHLSLMVLEEVTSLVDMSLLERQTLLPTSQANMPILAERFRMLEIIHEYALTRLEASGEAEELRQRHLDYYVALVEQIEPKLHSKNLFTLLGQLELEHANLQAALAWSLGQGLENSARFEKGLRLAGALAWFWYLRGYWSEGTTWLDGVMGQLQTTTLGVPQPILAKVYQCAGMLSVPQGNYNRTTAYLERSYALYHELGNRWGMAHALDMLAEVARQRGDYLTARPLYEKSLGLCVEIDDEFCANHEVIGLGYVSYQQGDYSAAHTYFEQGLKASHSMNDRSGVARTLNGLGELLRFERDYVQASTCYQESLKIYREIGQTGNVVLLLHNLGQLELAQQHYKKADSYFKSSIMLAFEINGKRLIGWCLAGLAEVAVGMGDFEQAARLFGAAEMLLETIGLALDPTNRPSYDRELAVLQSQLEASALKINWQAGRALSLEDALAIVLEGGVFSFNLH